MLVGISSECHLTVIFWYYHDILICQNIKLTVRFWKFETLKLSWYYFYIIKWLLSSSRVDSPGWWLLWYNMIHDSLKTFVRKLISRKACSDPFRKRLTSFSVGLPWTVCSFVCDFIALEIMESVLTFLDDNLRKFHVLYASTSGACALETRRRCVTERGKKESRNLNPGLTAWVIMTFSRSRIFFFFLFDKWSLSA